MGILSYNAIFGKTTEEGEKNLVESKWLSPNKEIEIYVGEVVWKDDGQTNFECEDE